MSAPRTAWLYALCVSACLEMDPATEGRLDREKAIASLFVPLENGDFLFDSDVVLSPQDAALLRDRLIYGEHALTRIGSEDSGFFWDDNRRRSLGYCIVESTFPAEEVPLIREAVAFAATQWEGAAGVDFIEQQTDGCLGPIETKAYFKIIGSSKSYLVPGRAFFPPGSPADVTSYDRSQTVELLWPSRYSSRYLEKFENSAQRAMNYVVAHELGHVLGFFHEWFNPHPASPAWNRIPGEFPCDLGNEFTRSNLFGVTSYDPLSIMNYPHDKPCGTGAITELSALDRLGAATVYPL